MNRRDFIAAGCGGVVGTAAGTPAPAVDRPAPVPVRSGAPASVRAEFPRLEHEIFLNAAGGTPLGNFAARGLDAYEEFMRFGGGEGRADWYREMMTGTRAGLARLLGAEAEEIAFVQSTKAGEQIVIDGLPALHAGGNLVTNDLHFSGSLHNLEGLRRAGVDVRIARSRDWATDLDAMAAAIDDDTALVSVTLLSNVNGHIEPIRELAELAHARGAYVYADVIQAVGIAPVDVRAMGIDFAAGNGYKWLYGPRGTGFLFVAREHQGTALQDRAFPGNVRHNYAPWTDMPDPDAGDFVYHPRDDARRYETGHQSYLGLAAVHEGIQFIESIGVDACLAHSVRLNRRLVDGLDPARYECTSPHLDRSPIVAFTVRGVDDLIDRLIAANVVITVAAADRIRVSTAIYNDEDDIDALVAALNRA